ncbi:hypothetical protein FQA39_LY07740 [Lamprigera yunnana]|nr:hypothetical protein FQA39_LY07740 [Lamprigera yunnana]
MDKFLEEDIDLIIGSLSLAGDDIQKLSVIQNLPQLLQLDQHQTYSRIIPKILQELPNSSCEFQVIASNVFRILMERQVTPNLFHAVLQGIEARDVIAASAWMETLISIIGILNNTQIKNNILPLVHTKSQLSQPLLARISACKLLGKIAVHKAFEPTNVKRDIVPLVQSLCQDCHPEVRSAMCTQLPFIAQGLGSALMKGDLLASLVELGADENMYVRSAAVTAIVYIIPYTCTEVRKATLLPLIKQLCERSVKQDDLTAMTIAKVIGKILEGLQDVLTVPETLWFLSFYKKLASKGLKMEDQFKGNDPAMDVTCRQQAAENLPAVCIFTHTTVLNQMDSVCAIFRELAGDPCFMIRRTVAGCIHDIIKIFGTNSKILKSDFVRLLQDDSEEVLSTLVPNLGNTLDLLCQYDILSRQIANAATLEVGRALLKCQYELATGNNWRLFTHFLHQLEHLPNCMPPDFIHQHFTPIVLACAVDGRARPVRVQAARTLLIFLRYNGKEMQRRWLRENLLTQLCHSNSYYTRLIYIRLCANAIDIFSDKYFKEYFYGHLLNMADDPIANIRLCVATLFTYLKQMLVLPEDKALSEKLNEVLKKYSNHERDRDVLEMFQIKMKEIKSMDMNKEEYKKEQKRRRDEEEKINSGAKPIVQLLNKKGQLTSSLLLQAPGEYDLNVKSKPPSASGTLKQSSSNLSSQVNDMSILEQHFYIDAGVTMPTKDLNSPKHSKLVSIFNVAKSKNQPTTSYLTSNVTDDDKVSFRKQPLTSNVPKINKRHSSIISETYLKKQEQKTLNRRSLNLSSKTTSRIPISTVKIKNELPPTVRSPTISHLPIR